MSFELFAQILGKISLRFLNWYLNITFEALSLSFPTFSFPSTEFRFFLLHANQPPHFPSAKHFPFFPPNFFTVLWRANFVTGLFLGCSFAVKEPKKSPVIRDERSRRWDVDKDISGLKDDRSVVLVTSCRGIFKHFSKEKKALRNFYWCKEQKIW